MPHRLELHFQKSKRTGITNRYHPLHKSNEKRLTEVYSVSLMSIAEKTGDYVGLRSPPPRILFFYEKSIQKRIKEEVSSLISPRAENLSESFEEWNNRSILGDNDTKLYFSTIYNIVSPPQSLRDAPPHLLHKPRLLRRRIFPLYLVIIIRNPYSKRRCFS